MPNQTESDKIYLQMAKLRASSSKARRLKVGCLIVKNNQIISEGYNGTPSGRDNNCENEIITCNEIDTFAPTCKNDWTYNSSSQEWLRLETKKEVLHAESNALMKLTRSTNSSEGATLYLTHSPCFECSKLIYQAGISRIVYEVDYRNSDGVNFLKELGLIVNKV